MPVNLYGEYPYKVDGKGRVGLPAAFRRVRLAEDSDLIVPDPEAGLRLGIREGGLRQMV